jgi:hypothetical protein
MLPLKQDFKQRVVVSTVNAIYIKKSIYKIINVKLMFVGDATNNLFLTRVAFTSIFINQ